MWEALLPACPSLHTATSDPALLACPRIYFNPVGGKPGILGSTVDITHEEFPPDWFEGLPPKAYRARTYTIGNNKYGVSSRYLSR